MTTTSNPPPTSPSKLNNSKCLLDVSTKLIDAAKRGNLSVVAEHRHLLAHTVDSPTKSTALHWACAKGHTNLVQYIIEHEPQLIDAANNMGETPLANACLKGYLSIVANILARRPDLCDAVSKLGFTPLQYACARGHVSLVAHMINNYPNCRSTLDNLGRNALQIACFSDRLPVVRYLIEIDPVCEFVRAEGGRNLLELVDISTESVFQYLQEHVQSPAFVSSILSSHLVPCTHSLFFVYLD